MIIRDAVFEVLAIEKRIGINNFYFNDSIICEFFWRENKIHLSDVDSNTFYESMREKSQYSTELVAKTIELNNIPFNEVNFMLFCVLHEVSHLIENTENQTDFLYSMGLHNFYREWLSKEHDIGNAYKLTKMYAAEIYGHSFATKFCAENAREYINSISYRCCESERIADKYAATMLLKIID